MHSGKKNKKAPPQKKKAVLPPPDRYLIWIVMTLAAIGIVAVYSAVAFLAETKADGHTERFLFRHMAYVVLSLGAMIGFSRIDYRTLVQYSRVALVITSLLLLLVQFVGITSGGAQRALRVGLLSFQPAELAKVALLLYVSLLIAKKQTYIHSFSRAFTPLFFWILSTVVLIGIEDLSTASMVLLAAIVMCFVGRVHIAQLSGLGVLMVLLAALFLLTSPARMARLEQYVGKNIVNTEQTSDTVNGDPYQAQQARIAFAMGGLTGRGPGKSTQRDFLPAPYNDFIFAIIAEEYGLLGAAGLLVLFATFLLRGYLSIARRAPDPLGLILAIGLTSIICLYGFVHAAVACGLLPVTGLPMPFVSYGGSSMLANGIMVGILLNISRHAIRA